MKAPPKFSPCGERLRRKISYHSQLRYKRFLMNYFVPARSGGMEIFMKLINIGFGNMVNASRLVAIVSPESAPIKRGIQEARE